MGGVSYNGKDIEPAPFCSLQKSFQVTGDGERIGTVWNITLEGKFLPYKGSPNSTGEFGLSYISYTSGVLSASGTSLSDESLSSDAYMTSILRKQEALRGLFAEEGKALYIQGWDNGQPIWSNPRIKGPIEYPKGNTTSWATIADYRINLESDVIYSGSGTFEDSANINLYKVENADENWQIEPQDYDLGSYRLTHRVGAKGKRFYSSSGTLDQPAWKNARDYVLNAIQLGIDTQFMYATGVLNNSNLSAYNYVRSQNVDERGGKFEVTENWLCYTTNNPAIESYDVDTNIDMAGYAKVSLKGKIEGLEVRNATTNVASSGKYLNAANKYNSVVSTFLARASGLANLTLNPTPLNRTYGTNPYTGVITYNYEYDNRPLATISGALSETVQVTFDYPTNVFATIGVLGRAAGPILQSIDTISSRKKRIVLEAVMPASTMTYTTTKPDTNSYVSGLAPTATWVFKTQDSENWNPYTGRYVRSIGWDFNS